METSGGVFQVLATILLAGLTGGTAWTADKPPLEYSYAPYNQGDMDPQLAGWPLSPEEEAFVLKPEHERRPGREANKHMPSLWPITPAAGYWSGRDWLETHAKLVGTVQRNKGPVDILLVGDSITQAWGGHELWDAPWNDAWRTHFGQYKAINIGIGGDKTQNVLWRLDHGGAEGIDPRVIVLMIGNNNMYFAPETGIEAAALGITACVKNLRARFPEAHVVLVKVLPAGEPESRFYQDIRRTNTALESLDINKDPKIHVLDLWNEFVNADGRVKTDLFIADKTHLSPEGGYQLLARKLEPLVEELLGGPGSTTPN